MQTEKQELELMYAKDEEVLRVEIQNLQEQLQSEKDKTEELEVEIEDLKEAKEVKIIELDGLK